MRLAAPESMLAALLAMPEGLDPACTDADAQATVTHLTARGYPLRRGADQRLRLECAAVHFDPQRFVAAKRGIFAHEFEVWESLESTNERVWELARAGAAPGTLVLSERQEAGRGRQGRRWQCPTHTGLLFSVLLDGDLEQSERPQLLPLALGLGVAQVLREETGLAIGLKWPNDILCREQKCGGVLVEARHPGKGIVVGCGLNVQVERTFFATHGLLGAGSLFVSGGGPAREVLLARVLEGMEARYLDWVAMRWEDLLPRFGELDMLRGRMVELESAGRRVRGRCRGITPTGLLAIERADGGIEAFAAGEVHLR